MAMRKLKIATSITDRSDSLDKYLQEIGKIKKPSAEEEIELIIKIRAGDEIAREKLTKGHSKFAVSVAKQYQHQGLSLPDLVNEANLGLMEAIDQKKYDETRGFKFISYAVWWIRRRINQALLDQSRIVRLPGNRARVKKQSYDKSLEFLQKYEREPTNEELAEELETTLEAINLSLSKPHESFDAPIAGSGGEIDRYDITPDPRIESPDKQIDHDASLKKDLEKSLGKLQKDQITILKYYFGIDSDYPPMSLKEVAEKMGYTLAKVSSLKVRAMHQLRRTEAKRPTLREYR